MTLTYKQKFNKKHGFKRDGPHPLAKISRVTGYTLKGLRGIYNKEI